MRNNPFKKYQKIMRTKNNYSRKIEYFIESDNGWYYIYNPFMLLRVNNKTYNTYFHGESPEQFPLMQDYEKTIAIRGKKNNLTMETINKLNIADRIPSDNNRPAIKTDVIIEDEHRNLKMRYFLVSDETEPFITVLNNEFQKAFYDIFGYSTMLYGGENEHKPILYVDNQNDVIGFILPIREIDHKNIKQAIINQYKEEVK